MTEPAYSENSAADIASRFINNTGRHIFLTGKAGTGKTTFLRYIIRHTYKIAAIAAPTGIAAINAGGVTLHSLFQLPFGAFIPSRTGFQSFPENLKINTPDSLLRGLQLNGTKRRILQELELLIIDEVSMLRADLLDAIDTTLRSVRRQKHLPFGGLQILFIGDLLQLPPVVKEDEWRYLEPYYQSPYFFDAQALQQSNPVYIEFDKIYRQQDDTFINLLNNLRTNQVTKEDIDLLNSHYKPGFKAGSEDGYINLTTHNYKADSINKEALQSLAEESFFFKATIEGDFSEYAYPIEVNLELKKGAQVMFIKNDPTGEKRFFNGKIGKVINLTTDQILVDPGEGQEPIQVERYTWENIKYNMVEATNEVVENIAGSFTQYPIRLAWAITVHKSQGLTFKKAIIDIGQAFVSGQVYVALSRLVSLEGLVLSAPIRTSTLSPDETIMGYAGNQAPKESLPEMLDQESIRFFRNYITSCFHFTDLEKIFKTHLDSYEKDEVKGIRKKYKTWATELYSRFEELQILTEKFRNQLMRIFDAAAPDYKGQVYDRTKAARDYFTPLLRGFSKDILAHKEKVKAEKKAKTYLEDLSLLEIMFYKQIKTISKATSMAESAFENVEFQRERINTDAENQERLKEINKTMPDALAKSLEEKLIKAREKRAKSGRNRDYEKSTIIRSQTKQVSYELFISGKTVEDIASERDMAIGTIEGHLAYFVELGLLPVASFLGMDMLKSIADTANILETVTASAIKEKLGEDVSYRDIKFGLAAWKAGKQ